MTQAEMIERIATIEHAITTQDFTFNAMLVLGGEWQGLHKAAGTHQESVWAMLWRLRRI